MSNKFEKHLPKGKTVQPSEFTKDYVKKITFDFAMAIDKTFNEFFKEMLEKNEPNACFEAYSKTLNDILSYSQSFIQKNPAVLTAIRKSSK